MFEIGRRYEFKMLMSGDETTFWGVVERYEHPLMKLQDTPPLNMEVRSETGEMILHHITDKSTPGMIINVSSPNFISAVLNER